MFRRIFPSVLLILSMLFPVAANAQQIIGYDPQFGPICAGPMGPGPCAQVQAWIQSQGGGIAPPPVLPPLQQIGSGPNGPICAGPLGPGPCAAVQQYLQQQFGQTPQIQQAAIPQLQQIGTDPFTGMAICLGPLGPGPCDAVRAYLAKLASPSLPVVTDLSAVKIHNSPNGEAICSGPTGRQPCSILQQEILDSGRQATIGALPDGQNLDPQALAQQCAQRAGLDVVNFASCTGGEMVLTDSQKKIIGCASESQTTEKFASCAAPLMGVKLDDRQQKLVDCARDSGADAGKLASCAGGAVLGKRATATLKCYRDNGDDKEAFAECAAGKLIGNALTEDQTEAIACVAKVEDGGDLALCAAEKAGLSDDQQAVVECVVQSQGDADDFVGCAGKGVVSKYIGRDASTALKCGVDAGNAEDFATCAATGILGKNATKEQKIALTCAANSGGDIDQMAVCAGANMLNMKLGLNPEQQIAVQCLVSTGGQPYAAAGCMATRLTARELTKCFTDGIGGKGCFGDTNDLVGKDGWTAQRLKDLAGGPNSVINNPDQIWGGNNSFVRNPGQVWGGNNSFVRNPGQIWGGDNSVFNNPGQLLPKPPEIKIGKTRICLPWC